MPVAIEIFRPGKHRDMSGREIDFTEDLLKTAAAAYDPKLHEAPACVGHPKHDAPAYAWATGLRFADGSLVADVDQVDPEFAEMVRAGRFKKISPSFYLPDSPANPKPGTFYLRHIGFLGAQPPAVKGLKPVAFAEEAGVVAFADWDKLNLVTALRSLRDFFIEKFGIDDADKAIPSWALDSMQNSAAQADADPTPQPAFAEVPPVQTPDMEAARKQLEQDQAALAAERAAFAEQQAATRRAEDVAFLDGLVKAGRLLPAQKDGAAAFLEAIADAGTVCFGEGAAKTEVSPRQWFRTFAAGAPHQVVFGEVAVPQELQRPGVGSYTPPPGYSVDPTRAELHTEALAYAEAKGIDYVTAVKAVSER